MDTNEIITEEVTEVLTNEMVDAGGMSKGLKAAMGIGAAALCGWLIYRYAVRPIVAKVQEKKANADNEVSDEEPETDNSEETSEEKT